MVTHVKILFLVLILIALSWPVAGCSADPSLVPPVPEEARSSTSPTESESLLAPRDPDTVTSDSAPETVVAEPEIDQITRRLKDLGPAPEFSALTWINAEPTTLTNLRGRVVMIEFWSFG